MGQIFTLDADTKSVIRQALDDLITELGKDCRLEYPPKMTTCANCIFDTVGNKSSNYWKNGGPQPFPNMTICPMCNGVGQMATSVTETIKFLCAWEPRNFFYPIRNLEIRMPYSIVQTKGYITDLPKVLSCDCMVIQLPIEGITRQRFELMRDPIDVSNIIQGRYFVATWERKG